MLSLWRMIGLCLISILFCVSGCKPVSTAQVDEEREAYYLDAKSKYFAEDYEEAVVAFQKALEVNPSNAAAHLELGLIYYQHLNDYISAIYHFQRMLALRPDHLMAGQIKEHLERCKMDFASSVNLGPLNHITAEKMRKLVEANTQLEEQVKNLEGRLLQMKSVLAAQNEAARQQQTVPSLASNATDSKSRSSQSEGGAASNASSRLIPSQVEGAVARFRKHVVKSGDNFFVLGRKYSVTHESIAKANPGIESTRLQIGHILNIPFAQDPAPRTTASR